LFLSQITSPNPNATVNITSFSIDGNYPNGTFLRTFIRIAGGTTLNITKGAPENLTGVPIVLHFTDGTEDNFGVITLIIRGPNKAPILSDDYSFSIPENSANEDLVGTIDFTDEIPNSVRFTSSLSSIFGFQPNTNRIVVLNSAALDRETKDTYTFMINATDSEGLQSSANVTVTLTDVNDQIPVINNTQSELYRIIIQSAPNGYSLVNMSASDGDEGANSEYSFSLDDPSLPFSISGSHLYVNGTLEAKTYSVVVIVTDKGMPPLSSNGTVTVQVEPRNDFSPSFVSTPYTFSFLENSNGSVFTFSITDGDTGGVGSPGSANLSLATTTYSSSFSLTASHDTPNATTGYLTVLSQFDRETLPTFNLTIVAFDTGYPEFRKTSETNVIVEVSDANDHPPEFSKSVYYANLAENASTGYQFLRVVASDNDTVVDSSLTYSILNFQSTFSINTTSGWIMVSGTLNRALHPNYTLSLQVNDSSNYTDTAQVIITVIEVNDHIPRFEPPLPLSVNISENQEYSLNVSVIDQDLGPAGTVTISVSNDTYFEIQDNQRLVLKDPFNYESTSVVNVTVLASDDGDPRLSTSATITVNVEDINEFPPQFSSANYTKTTLNVSIDTVLVTVSATDADGRDNSITYSFAPDGDTALFAINEKTGQISLSSSFPALGPTQASLSYTFDVIATDNGQPETMSSNASVTITVITPDNFHDPQLGNTSYTGSLVEKASIGTPILTVTATDADVSVSASSVQFFLTGTNAHLFTIENFDNNTALMKSNFTADYENMKSVGNVAVFARDNGNSPRTSDNAEITVFIVNVNDNEPTFVENVFVFNLNEGTDTPINSTVGNINATDLDGNTLTYSIEQVPGSPVFIPVNGGQQVMFTGPSLLDYDESPDNRSFNYTIDVTDGEFNDTAILTVNVVDINDNDPVFMDTHYMFTIAENLPVNPNMAIGTVTAIDDDSGQNKEISYSLNTTRFIINSTGSIFPNDVFDRELTPSIQLLVTATDNGVPPRHTNEPVTIIIENRNDEAPVFAGTINTNISIKENATRDQYIGDIKFRDLDNSSLIYSIIGGSGRNYFYIENNSSLYVANNNQFDYENVSMRVLTLIVQASDGTFASNVSLTVNIVNVDDSQPMF
ncbi:PREDICTED: protocadherin-16-like, partial [Amphimedon queenslandica]|uniref:Cadherin domain-containing protein n=1 Tax=Amphimedon queenslandica TaxID=400682 RepID=A0AAN0J3P6_AMPQE